MVYWGIAGHLAIFKCIYVHVSLTGASIEKARMLVGLV